MSKNLAGLLMCGMISDTLNLTSPTTTEVDRALMADLAKASGINPADLAAEIFSVGSPLLTMSPNEAVTADSKEYEHGSHRYSVAQIEELSFAPFEAKREALARGAGSASRRKRLPLHRLADHRHQHAKFDSPRPR